MDLNTTNARSFNTSLKKAFLEAFGLKVKVEIINSYKFPRCYTRVYSEGVVFPNPLRNKAAKIVYPTTHEDVEDCNLGNIRHHYISIHVPEWEKLFSDISVTSESN